MKLRNDQKLIDLRTCYLLLTDVYNLHEAIQGVTLYTISSSKPEIAKIVFSEKQYIYSNPELVVPIMISLIEDCHYPHNEAV